MAEELTRGQRAAATRKRNLEAKARKEAVESENWIEGWELNQPPIGSVLMAHGPKGTAYQRFADGLWHGTNGVVINFGELLGLGRLVLIHVA